MLKLIAHELRNHAPFTALGAVTGIIVMVIIVFGKVLPQVSSISHTLFYVLHPLHVALSAVVTTAMYKTRSQGRAKAWAIILIGYVGSIGIGTLSDSVIPYLGEMLLNLPHREIHIGFLEEAQIVNPAAFAGIALGYWRPTTKLPHFGHVLLSTWASLFHVVMALGSTVNLMTLSFIFVILFLGVWLPCCTSDIVFPLLFTSQKLLHEHG
jgi:hypothetical protein